MKRMTEVWRRLGALAAITLVSVVAKAESADGLFVQANDQTQNFAISEIKEVLFSDEKLTVVKSDNTQVQFQGEWVITFDTRNPTGGSNSVQFAVADEPVEVFSLDGILLFKAESLSALDVDALPQGVYIVKCNGKSLKIKK